MTDFIEGSFQSEALSISERAVVEKLIPTPITELAGQRLNEWGIGESEKQKLQEFSSKFKYDVCDVHLKEILKYPVTWNRDSSKLELKFDGYNRNPEGDWFGSCGVLARGFVKQINLS